MKIWLYCSYSGSPTGFRLGCVDSNDPSGKIIKGNPHKLLDRCFSYQGITKAYGKIPDSNSYVFFRPIERQKEDSLFLNVGFESADNSEYKHICSFFDQFSTRAGTYDNRERKKNRLRSKEEDKLFKLLEAVIIKAPDDLDFGICVNQQKLTALIDAIKGYQISEEHDELGDKFYIQLASDMGAEDFAANFRLSLILGEAYKFDTTNNKRSESLFVIVRAGSISRQSHQQPAAETQKKTGTGRKYLPILLIITVIIILIIALSGKNKAQGFEEPQKRETTIVQEVSQ